MLPRQFDEAELVALDLLDATTLAALKAFEDLMLETATALELDLLLAIELAALALLDETTLETAAALDAATVGIEHSLTPPATVLPVPKVASLQTKLPLKTL